MSKAQLKKATITVLDGADKGKVITRPVQSRPSTASSAPTRTRRRRCRDSARRCCSSSTASATSSAWSCSSTTTPIPKGPTSLLQQEKDPLIKRPDGPLEAARDRSRPARAAAGALQLGTDGVLRGHREARPQGHDVPPGRHAGARDAVGQLQGIPHAAPAARGSATRVGRQDQAPRRRRHAKRSGASPRASTTTRTSGSGSPRPTTSTIRARSRRATGCCCLRSRIPMELATLAKTLRRLLRAGVRRPPRAATI